MDESRPWAKQHKHRYRVWTGYNPHSYFLFYCECNYVCRFNKTAFKKLVRG